MNQVFMLCVGLLWVLCSFLLTNLSIPAPIPYYHNYFSCRVSLDSSWDQFPYTLFWLLHTRGCRLCLSDDASYFIKLHFPLGFELCSSGYSLVASFSALLDCHHIWLLFLYYYSLGLYILVLLKIKFVFAPYCLLFLIVSFLIAFKWYFRMATLTQPFKTFSMGFLLCYWNGLILGPIPPSKLVSLVPVEECIPSHLPPGLLTLTAGWG